MCWVFAWIIFMYRKHGLLDHSWTRFFWILQRFVTYLIHHHAYEFHALLEVDFPSESIDQFWKSEFIVVSSKIFTTVALLFGTLVLKRLISSISSCLVFKNCPQGLLLKMTIILNAGRNFRPDLTYMTCF